VQPRPPTRPPGGRYAAARLLLAAALLLVLLAACGGSEKEEAAAAPVAAEAGGPAANGTDASLPDWVKSRLAKKDGDDLVVFFGTADHAVGPNRVSFVVVRPDQSIVQASEAGVYLAQEGSDAVVQTRAALVPLEAHSHPEETTPHNHPDATDLYVANVDFPKPGRYWFVIEPAGTSIQASGAVDVAQKTTSPAVGSKAIPSDNPTLRDASAEEITTAKPPDTELLRYSIADSLEAGAPFVVAFATPFFCQSRTCGPTVEVMEQVRKTFASSGIRFIHVEIYADNDPQKGVNRWVEEWKLPTEPWVFLVDEEGIIRAKFEGSVSVDELTAAVRTHLS